MEVGSLEVKKMNLEELMHIELEVAVEEDEDTDFCAFTCVITCSQTSITNC